MERPPPPSRQFAVPGDDNDNASDSDDTQILSAPPPRPTTTTTRTPAPPPARRAPANDPGTQEVAGEERESEAEEKPRSAPSPLAALASSSTLTGIDDFPGGNDIGYSEDTIKESYLVKRLGVGLIYWEIRYLSLRRTPNGTFTLSFFANHFKGQGLSGKGKTELAKGSSSCCVFDRDAYAEGRRKNLFGVRTKKGRSEQLTVLDAPTAQVRQAWLSTFVSLGIPNMGLVHAEKRNDLSVREGWIRKLGQNVSSWKSRYFVLLPQMAMYYKWSKDKRPQGVISLNKDSTIELDPHPKRANHFIIVPNPGTPEVRTYKLKAHDLEHRDLWIKAFNECINGMQ